MCEFKSQPLQNIMRMVHPDLYRLDTISDQVRSRPGLYSLVSLSTTPQSPSDWTAACQCVAPTCGTRADVPVKTHCSQNPA